MLTTHLFRYTSECTISWSNCQNFFALGGKGGIDSPNQNPADVPDNRWQFSGGMYVQRGANVARLRETTTGNGQKKEKRAPKARRGESVGRHCDVAAMNTLNRR